MKNKESLDNGFYQELLERGAVKDENMEPDLDSHLSIFVDAFFDLSADRQVGFGVGAIPFQSIFQYWKCFKIGQDFEVFFQIIKQMDKAFIEFSNKESKINGSRNR